MTTLEWVLFVAAAGVAVRMLVQMMRQRAATLVSQVQQQVDAHHAREIERKKKAREKAAREAFRKAS
ncbi:hypothetical protein [Botrimarina sp.]|uniref:hypothetical protein n=1 Tax=Botrimarina sp. TaxID=2795802 RepID=UPI0032EE04CE